MLRTPVDDIDSALVFFFQVSVDLSPDLAAEWTFGIAMDPPYFLICAAT
jgi:hypothetical protein